MNTKQVANFWNWFSRFSQVYQLVHKLPWKTLFFGWMNLLHTYGFFAGMVVRSISNKARMEPVQI